MGRYEEFTPDWAKKMHAHDDWPDQSTWPRKAFTCTTAGCHNEGWPIEMPYIGDPIICGVCGVRLDQPAPVVVEAPALVAPAAQEPTSPGHNKTKE